MKPQKRMFAFLSIILVFSLFAACAGSATQQSPAPTVAQPQPVSQVELTKAPEPTKAS